MSVKVFCVVIYSVELKKLLTEACQRSLCCCEWPSCAVFQSDVGDSEDAASQCNEENSADVGVGCDAEGRGASSRDAAQKSSVASEANTQQTKPKKLNKKQLLAEQRRKDRVCAEIFIVVSHVAHILYATTLR